MTSGTTEQEDQGASASHEANGEPSSLQRDSTRVLPRPSVITDAPVRVESAGVPEPKQRNQSAGAPASGGEPAQNFNAAAAAPGAAGEVETAGEAAVEAAVEAAAAVEVEVEAPRLSVEEADRFAASIRPSWVPPAGAAADVAIPSPGRLPSIDGGPAGGGHASTAQRVAVRTTDPFLTDDGRVSIESIAGRRQGRRGLLLAAGAVAGFALLGVLMLGGGESEPTQAWDDSAVQPEEPTSVKRAISPKPAPGPVAGAKAHPRLPSGTSEIHAGPEAAPVVVQEETRGAGAVEGAANLNGPEPQAIEQQAPAAEPAPVPQVKLSVTLAPNVGKLSVDGTVVVHPYSAQVDKGSQVTLEAQADGYAPQTVEVELERNRKIALRLKRVRRPQVAASQPEPRPKPQQTPRPRPTPQRQPVATPEPARATPAPATAKRVEPSRGAGFVTESPY